MAPFTPVNRNSNISASQLTTNSSKGPETVPLPKDYASIEDVLSMDVGKLVNVFGLIKDFRVPIATRGTEWKCTFDIYDISTQDVDYSCKRGVEVAIFLPLPKMQPAILHDQVGKGDVVVLRKMKVQKQPRMSTNSLLSNYATSFQILKAAKIPDWPVKAKNLTEALLCGHKTATLSQAEVDYIIWFRSMIDTDALPSTGEFQQSVQQTANFRDKFRLCKDVQERVFCDLLVEVRRVHDDGDRSTIHVSDYTANSHFFNRERPVKNNFLKEQLEAMEGDDYGYLREHRLKHSGSVISNELSRLSNGYGYIGHNADEWPGPYGKMSFQITAWGANADYFNEHLKVGDWVELKNVQIRFSDAGHLEGRMSEDRLRYAGDLRVKKVVFDGEEVDPRFKDAVRRKREYTKKLRSDEVKEKKKEEPMEVNSKSSGRKRRREAKEQVAHKETPAKEDTIVQTNHDAKVLTEEKIVPKADHNPKVKCASQSVPAVSISLMLSYIHNHIELLGSDALFMPFINRIYRVNVRVVDYYPHDIRHFSVGHRTSEFDILSDNSSDSNTDNEGDMSDFRNGKGFGPARSWKWRFALLVEDATASVEIGEDRPRAWIHVDNESAQYLHDLDAAPLFQNTLTLTLLREKLFLLWGDLEEKKSAYLNSAYGKALLYSAETPLSRRTAAFHSDTGTRTPQTPTSKRRKLARNGRTPSVDSSRSPSPDSRPTTASHTNGNGSKAALPTLGDLATLPQDQALELLEAQIAELQISNRGFGACVRSYGVRVPSSSELDTEDEDGSGSEAEHRKEREIVDGEEWMRMFMLFGTRITY